MCFKGFGSIFSFFSNYHCLTPAGHSGLLRQCFKRQSDTVARVGGDEFVVLLREIDSTQSALAVSEKIRMGIDEPFRIEDQDIQIGCCVGVAIYPDHGSTAMELSAHADAAMYQAKGMGGNRVRLADSGGMQGVI